MRTSAVTLLTLLTSVAAVAQTDLTLRVHGESITLPLDTPVLIDGQPATLFDLRYRRNGMQLDLDTGINALGAPTPIFSYTLIGPVTRSQPLEVLGQALTITADTELAGVTAPFALPVGTPLVVAGLVDSNGSVLATLVERRGSQGPRFLLTGPVTQIGATPELVRVGDQWVSLASAAPVDCAAANPVVGEFLEVRADAVVPLPPDSTITGVTDARCVALVASGTPGAIGFLEGLVSTDPLPDRFQIGALEVRFDANTLFESGTVDDLDLGAAVIVHGAYVDATTMTADSIEFVRSVVRFEAPMAPADVTPGVSLRPFGLVVNWSAQVRDEDGILANGLAVPGQVEVRGYIDSSGQAYATRVRERGNADPADVVLRGPVEAINDPFITIQQRQIDTTGATFEDEFGNALSAAEFFAGVAIGHEAGVSGAIWHPANQQISGGIVLWVDAPAPMPRPAGVVNPVSHQSGTATEYALPDELFVGTFESF